MIKLHAARSPAGIAWFYWARRWAPCSEAYDFYLAGSLAVFISRHFFSGVAPAAGFIFTLLGFAAGFAVRPFGALVFGRLGDMVGRKYTFLATVVLMGASTFLVGIIPDYAQVGMIAPIAFIGLRLLQGLALGGEYGGAAIYVAEHAPPGKRGAWTAWIQTPATMSLFLSLVVILAIRIATGEDAFGRWGWRLPFLSSAVILMFSIWLRLRLHESPIFAKIKAQGKLSKAPLSEAFGHWKNIRLSLIALFGLVAGQAVVLYTGQFYALFFLTQTLKVSGATANVMIGIALLIGTPFFIVFGALSDRIGRKPVIMAGCLIACLTYFPMFKALTHFVNPALETALLSSPITVFADPAQCSLQFNPVGTASFTKPCDIAKGALAREGLNYDNVAAPASALAEIRIGRSVIRAYDGKDRDAPTRAAAFNTSLKTALKTAGYPERADPARINWLMACLILTTLTLYITMAYGPIAAILVEMFPTRIRYSAMSLPYHIGNGWFGGFLPASAFAIVAAKGNIYSGLWYPVAITGMTFVIGMIFVKETKGIEL